MGWIGLAAVVTGLFGAIGYWLRKRESDGSFDIERKKTEKGTSFIFPGGGGGG